MRAVATPDLVPPIRPIQLVPQLLGMKLESSPLFGVQFSLLLEVRLGTIRAVQGPVFGLGELSSLALVPHVYHDE